MCMEGVNPGPSLLLMKLVEIASLQPKGSRCQAFSQCHHCHINLSLVFIEFFVFSLVFIFLTLSLIKLYLCLSSLYSQFLACDIYDSSC